MALLEIRDAAVVHGGRTVIGPIRLSLDEGQHVAYACADETQAQVLALLAAGLLRAGAGRLYVAAFDPAIQPVQVKRIVGYVPHEAVPHDFSSLSRYVEFRAALWGLPRAQALVRAHGLHARLDGIHEAFAYPLIGALLAHPRLLVLDRPQAAYAAQILEVAGTCAVLSTHGSQREADRFRAGLPAIA
jgi:ABC-2 type transport system ATP-binding protein